MLTLKFRELDNFRTMIAVEAKLKQQVGEAVRATAEEIVDDIRKNWSATSPSAVGSPPAVVTGLLDSSVMVEDQGRDEKGRFKGDDATVYYIHVDTAEGEPNGYNYAMALEDPAYLDRPFLAPALLAAEGYYTSNIQRFVRL